MDPDRRTTEAPLFGDPPNPIDPPSGCRFHTRCKFAAPVCSATAPVLAEIGPAHRVACLMACRTRGIRRLGRGRMSGTSAPTPIVDVENLTVDFHGGPKPLRAVAGVDLTLRPGEVLALLGESGSGKSVTLRALMRLLPERRAVIGGNVTVDGHDVRALSRRDLTAYRGRTIAMIFQEPGLALDPVYRVGDQITEAVIRHEGISRSAARDRALKLFERVRIPSAAKRLDNYAHEMSGGMRQRAMIALALACRPRCCSPTSRPPRSTPPCRSRCCCCCANCSASSALR